MVEQVSEGTPTSQYYPQEEVDHSLSTATFQCIIETAIPDPRLAARIVKALQDRGIFTCDKTLGSGAFGSVFQVEGPNAKKFALKLIPNKNNHEQSSTSITEFSSDLTDSPYHPSCITTSNGTSLLNLSSETSPIHSLPSISQNHPTLSGNWFRSRISKQKGIIGDGLALNFSITGHLTAAFALLLFNGETVEIVEKVDLERDDEKAVIGILSEVATGGALIKRISQYSPDSDTIKGYGRDLALALHELHSLGYAHRDLHLGNVLIFENDFGSTARLTDFGLSLKITPSSRKWDWIRFGEIIRYMDSSADPTLDSLLYHPTKGLLSPKGTINEEEILNHPYFLKSNTSTTSAA